MDHPIVTWTTPWQAANAAWLEAAEHMEFHRWAEAEAALRRHLHHLRATIEQMGRERTRDREIAERLLAQHALLLRGGGEAMVVW